MLLGDEGPVIIICIPLIAKALALPLSLKLIHLFAAKLFRGPELQQPLLIRVINHREHLKPTEVAELYGFFQKASLAFLKSIQTICLVSYVVYVVNLLSDHKIK